MTITPDQARKLIVESPSKGSWKEDDCTVKDPWGWSIFVDEENETAATATKGDAKLVAAAPDLAATIAGMEWEWGARDSSGAMLPIDPDNRWDDEQEAPVWEARTEVEPCLDQLREEYEGVRLVRRLVGPVEEVEG